LPLPVETAAGIEPAFDLAAYYPLLLFGGLVLGLATAMLTSTHSGHFVRFLKPNKPTKVKQMAYESGMDPIGSARMQFDIKFYLIAILFLVFDVELLFLYPWAVIAYSGGSWQASFGTIVFGEIAIFMLTLVIAYAYAWKKGVFEWR
jgi:NADH:ubiquinone oxidoreductase subunit 3 (subunit A)